MINKQAAWNIVRFCPNACNHCFLATTCRIKEHVDYETAERILAKLINAGICQISMKRGEPFLLPWLVRLIGSANSRGVNFHILSGGNGLLAAKTKQLMQLSGHNTLVLSLDAHTSMLNDSIRYKGSFNKVCRALLQFKKRRNVEGCNLRVGVSHTITSITLKHLKKFLDMMSCFDVDYVDIGWVWDVGSSKGKALCLKKEEEFLLQRRIRQLSVKYPFIIRFPAMKSRRDPHIRLCSAGDEINIDFKGNVLPCGMIDDEFANCAALTGKYPQQKVRNILRGSIAWCLDSKVYLEFKARFKRANKIRQNFKSCRKCKSRTYCVICPFVIEDLISRKMQDKTAACRYPINVP